MDSIFGSNLPQIYHNHITLTEIKQSTVDINPLGEELTVEIVAIQTEEDNPLSMFLRSNSGILFSIPTIRENLGLLVEENNLLTVTERDSNDCQLCGKDQTYGRSLLTYRIDRSDPEFAPFWVGVDCLTHIDKSLEEISENINSDAVSELI